MNRRGFITGLISLVAAPAIIRAGSLMPVKQMLDVSVKLNLSRYYAYDGAVLSCIPHPDDSEVYGDVFRVLERCEKLMLQTTAVYGGYLNPN
jgi:hypothetical protein